MASPDGALLRRFNSEYVPFNVAGVKVPAVITSLPVPIGLNGVLTVVCNSPLMALPSVMVPVKSLTPAPRKRNPVPPSTLTCTVPTSTLMFPLPCKLPVNTISLAATGFCASAP